MQRVWAREAPDLAFSVDLIRVEAQTGYRMIEARPGFQLALAFDPEGNVIELNEYADIASYRDDLAA